MFSKQGGLKAPVFKTPLTVLKRGRFENGGPVFKPYVFKTPKRFETPRFENASPVPEHAPHFLVTRSTKILQQYTAVQSTTTTT